MQFGKIRSSHTIHRLHYFLELEYIHLNITKSNEISVHNTSTHHMIRPDRVRVSPKCETVECKTVAEATLFPRWCGDGEPRHGEVHSGRLRSVMLMLPDLQVEERWPPLLVVLRRRRRQRRSSDTVALGALWWRYHLVGGQSFRSIRTRCTSLRIRWWWWCQDHVRGRGVRRPGDIFRLMYVCDETPYMYVLIVTTSWRVRELRMEGHVAPSLCIIRRASGTAPARDLWMWWPSRATSIVTPLVLGGYYLERAAAWSWAGGGRHEWKRLSVWPSRSARHNINIYIFYWALNSVVKTSYNN